MEISKVFTCDSAHRLPYVPEGHKCGCLHRHSFRIEIWVKGQVQEESGWVMDFADVSKIFQPIYHHQATTNRNGIVLVSANGVVSTAGDGLMFAVGTRGIKGTADVADVEAEGGTALTGVAS